MKKRILPLLLAFLVFAGIFAPFSVNAEAIGRPFASATSASASLRAEPTSATSASPTSAKPGVRANETRNVGKVSVLMDDGEGGAPEEATYGIFRIEAGSEIFVGSLYCNSDKRTEYELFYGDYCLYQFFLSPGYDTVPPTV